LAFIAVFLTGCATNRSEVALVPMADKAGVIAERHGRQVSVTSVVDERVFQDGSADPSVPSLGFGGVEAATAEMRSRAIARKRNTFGKALGDVVLQEGQTVPKVVRAATEQALVDAGFTVVPMADAKPGTTAVKVRIRQFWAWMTPGFWALTFENKIEVGLEPEGKGATDIRAYASDTGQLGTDGAYVGIVAKGLADYQAKVSAWARSAGF
jgi:hypothetical protein